MIAVWVAVVAIAALMGKGSGDPVWPIIGLMAVVGMGAELAGRRVRK